LIGTALGWGGNPDKDATYLNVTPAKNDGSTVYKLNATPPIPRVEPVKLPTGREQEIKFKTDAAGLKLALRLELLSTGAADAPMRTLRSVYFDTPAGDLRKQRMVLPSIVP